MTTYSHSKLSTFEQCPYKYKLHYIDKEEEDIPNTIEPFLGDMVHQTLEKLYKDLKFQKVNSLRQILKFYNDLWKKEWNEDILIVKSLLKARNYKKMGEKFITDYYNHYTPFDQMTILGLETQDKMMLSDGSYYHVRIDKLACKGDVYYVCDYKTNSHLKDQEEADSDRQLAMYSIFVKDKFKDAKKVILLWHMLAFDKEVTSERTEEQLKQLQEETINLIKEIENCNNFKTNVTNLCNYCGYKSKCPSFKHELKLETETVEEFKKDDGVNFVDEFSQLQENKKEIEEKIEQLKEKLILFSKQEQVDVVYGSNKKASVKEYEKIEYPEDKQELLNLLKRKSLYDEYSQICYQRLGPAILKEKLTDQDILKLVKKEKDFRISVSNRKDEEE